MSRSFFDGAMICNPLCRAKDGSTSAARPSGKSKLRCCAIAVPAPSASALAPPRIMAVHFNLVMSLLPPHDAPWVRAFPRAHGYRRAPDWLIDKKSHCFDAGITAGWRPSGLPCGKPRHPLPAPGCMAAGHIGKDSGARIIRHGHRHIFYMRSVFHPIRRICPDTSLNSHDRLGEGADRFRTAGLSGLHAISVRTNRRYGAGFRGGSSMVCRLTTSFRKPTPSSPAWQRSTISKIRAPISFAPRCRWWPANCVERRSYPWKR